MTSDLEIARQTRLLPIAEVAAKLDLRPDELIAFGPDKAKITRAAIAARGPLPDGKLVLVTAVTPTAAGEGKTTTTIGLGQALQRLGHRSVTAIREPSLGPVFGAKGGAAGGGHAQVVPMEDINLHFTGDFAAITAAHNLIAAMLDNHLHRGNALRIDPRRVLWRRVIDMNDRSLHTIVTGLGGRRGGVPRESGFDITPASEVMAVLCLARDLADLKQRLGSIVVAPKGGGGYARSADLGAQGAAAALLRDAMLPNLVQDLEGGPALIHGGPFANIAHGCNTLIATRLGLKLADYVVTEAGFGSDLGAEKFINVKCRSGRIWPSAAVLVATVRALKLHGGAAADQLDIPDVEAVGRGIPNLEAHVGILRRLGVTPIVSINRFASDSDAEVDAIVEAARALGTPAAVNTAFSDGGAGAAELAQKVIEVADRSNAEPKWLYPSDMSLTEKIEIVAREVYGADGVDFADSARRRLRRLDRGLGRGLPVCMAKTQYSLSDDPSKLGRPKGFRIAVRDAAVSAGAGFVIVYTGDVLTMPGLPARPNAENIDVDADGRINGLA